ncbi:unnamed protein product [Diamesa tonsa]
MMVLGYEETDPPSIECLVDYLKTQKVTDEYFDSVNELPRNKLNDCKLAIDNAIEDIEDEFIEEYTKGPSKGAYVHCAYGECCDNKSYQNLKLKTEALDRVRAFWKFWNYFQKGTQIDELKKKTKRMEQRAIAKCKISNDFGDLFDTNFESRGVKKHDYDGEREYCIRDYLLKKNMIDPGAFGFELNPRRVRTDRVICSDVLDILIDDTYRYVATRYENCEEIYKSSNYVDYILKAEVLGKLNLSNYDKLNERQSFVQSMTAIAYELKSQNC